MLTRKRTLRQILGDFVEDVIEDHSEEAAGLAIAIAAVTLLFLLSRCVT